MSDKHAFIEFSGWASCAYGLFIDCEIAQTVRHKEGSQIRKVPTIFFNIFFLLLSRPFFFKVWHNNVGL